MKTTRRSLDRKPVQVSGGRVTRSRSKAPRKRAQPLKCLFACNKVSRSISNEIAFLAPGPKVSLTFTFLDRDMNIVTTKRGTEGRYESWTMEIPVSPDQAAYLRVRGPVPTTADFLITLDEICYHFDHVLGYTVQDVSCDYEEDGSYLIPLKGYIGDYREGYYDGRVVSLVNNCDDIRIAKMEGYAKSLKDLNNVVDF